MSSQNRGSASANSDDEVEFIGNDETIGRVYSPNEIKSYFLAGFGIYFLISAMNPFGYFLYKDLPYLIALYAKVLTVLSILGTIALIVIYIYLKWVCLILH